MSFVAIHSPMLGTEVEIRVDADPEAALAADAAVVSEFERLAAVFSMYDESSELARWRHGDVGDCSAELTAVLTAAEAWHAASGGAFHPAIQPLQLRWQQAAAEDVLPDPAELAELAAACVALPFTAASGRIERTADCSGVDLNAIAKGYIVDRVAAIAFAVPQVDAVMINASGDLRHLGKGSVLVGIEDPAARFEGTDPRWWVQLAQAGLSTSGIGKRGFMVGGQSFSRVIDPRTGWPVTHTTSASVVASDAMTADVLSTALGVLAPLEALSRAEEDGWACLLIGADGVERMSSAWPATDRDGTSDDELEPETSRFE
jgi:thiamine biosynthesis lipoprotein